MRKYLACVYLPILLIGYLNAQSSPIRFSSLTPQNGLESGYNYYIQKDTRGMIWISSVNGVYRFDGLNMRSWTVKEGLADNIVQSNFFEDENGDIWFSTYTGVNRYIRSSDKISSFNLIVDLQDTIKTDYYLICLEKDHVFWLRAGPYLCRYDASTGQITSLGTTEGVRFGVQNRENGSIKAIYACPWMNAQGVELFLFDEDGCFEKHNLLNEDHSGRKFEIVNALPENDTAAWLFSNQGLIEFSSSHPYHYSVFPSPDEENPQLRNGISLDSRFLITLSRNNKPLLFDKQIRQFTNDNDIPDFSNLNEEGYQELMLDREGIIWFGQEKNPGVAFARMYPRFFTQPGTQNHSVMSVFESNKGEIWCATEGDGVYVFERNGDLSQTIPYKKEGGGYFNLRFGLVKDVIGKIWATDGKALFSWNEKSKNWPPINLKINKIQRIGNSNTGNLLISSTDRFYQLDTNENLISSNLFPGLKTFDGILTFFGSSGRIYSFSNNHLFINSKTDSEPIKLQTPFPPATIWEDIVRKRTWFGTTMGLSYWDWNTVRIENTAGPDFNNTMVTAITGDHSNRLWIGTYKGIYSYDPEKRLVHQFREKEGLPSMSISLSAALTASDGHIWFGTAKGPVVFDPDKVRPYPYGPPIHIDEFKIDNEPYRGTPVASEATRINLAHFQNNLSFRLKAVGFYLPEFSTIRYRLKNYEKDWQELENGGTINYHQLPPGAYQLEMVGVNTNGVAGTPKMLSLVINPPWWQRWWFRASVILTAISLIYLAFRFYLRRKLREQQRIFERQKALQEERNRIAAELHDDLGAGLSIIRFLSDDTLQKEEPGAFRQNISRIYHSAGELLEKMSDIIWAMNADNDTLANLVAHLQGYAYEYLDINRLLCRFEVPESLPDLPLSGAQRRNVLLSVKEALHNIVKHAEASEVDLTLSVQPDLLRIIIQDNGSGIDLHHLRTGGNGVRNIRRRMEAVGGSVDFKTNAGTIVTLSLPVSL